MTRMVLALIFTVLAGLLLPVALSAAALSLFALRSLNGKTLLPSATLAMLALVTALTVKITAIGFALATVPVIVARHRQDSSALRQALVGLVGGGFNGR